MLVFLMLNNIEIEYEDDDLTNLILDIASGQIDNNQLLLWLQQHIS